MTDGKGFMIATLTFSVFIAVVSACIIMYGLKKLLYSRFLDNKLNQLKAK